MRRSSIAAFWCAVAVGCLGPNPNADDDHGTTNTETGTDTDTGSGTNTETDTGDPDPTCDDDAANQDETAVDCGGDTCEPCPDGETCDDGDDCVSKVCDIVCQAPRCDDEVQNGGEGTADCGGACEVCVLDPLHHDWADPDEDQETQPTVDMRSDGRFAIAWVTAGGDIRFRWFEADASPSDGFSAHATTVQPESAPSVRILDAMEPELILCFLAPDPNDEPDLVMRRFDISGGANSGPVEIDVNVVVDPVGFAFDLDGNTAAFAWHDGASLVARRYDLEESEFLEFEDIDVGANVSATPVSLTYGPDADFVVGWTDTLGDFDFEAFVRRRTNLGAWADAPAAANAYSEDDIQIEPSVAALADGGFVVVWHGATAGNLSNGVAGRLLDETGTPVGEDLEISGLLVNDHEQPSAVATRDGFAVAWRDTTSDTIWLRRFDSAGEPLYDEEAPWDATPDLQPGAPAIAADDTQIVLLWSAGSMDVEVMGVRLAY